MTIGVGGGPVGSDVGVVGSNGGRPGNGSTGLGLDGTDHGLKSFESYLQFDFVPDFVYIGMHFLPQVRLYPGMHDGGLPTGRWDVFLDALLLLNPRLWRNLEFVTESFFFGFGLGFDFFLDDVDDAPQYDAQAFIHDEVALRLTIFLL